jgi:hypothetical protein
MRDVSGCIVVSCVGVWWVCWGNMQEHSRILEWSGPLERNTLCHPLLLVLF